MKRSWLTTVCVLVLTAALAIGCAYVPVQQAPAQSPAATDDKQEESAATEDAEADAQEASADDTQSTDEESTSEEAESTETADATEADPDADPDAEAEEDTPISLALAQSGKPWIDASAKEALTEDMELSPRDNFYLYVNYDYLMRRKNGEKDPNESYEKMLGEVQSLLEDDKAEDHYVELSQQFYKAYVDADTRNKDGVEPLRPVVEDIQSISSLDEMTEFLTDADRSINVPLMVRLMKTNDDDKPDEYMGAVYFRSFAELSLGDGSQYTERNEEGEKTYKENKERITGDLMQLGYSEEDAAQAYEDFIAVETVLASELDTMMDVMKERGKNVIEKTTAADICETMGDFPMKGIMESRGYSPDADYMIENRGYLKLVGDYYKEENLDLIKNYHLVSFLLKYGAVCRVPDPESLKDFAGQFDMIKYYLYDILDNAYLARYDRSKERQILLDFGAQMKDVYASIIREADWMSDETKEKAIAKLMDLKLLMLYGDHPVDYSSVDFTDKSLPEMLMALDAFREKLDASLVGEKVIPDQRAFTWMPTLENNARAFPEMNSLMFTVGIVDEYGDITKMSKEELYATIGYVLAHEMSHDFDENGSKMDITGRQTNWWTEEERAAFEARVQKVIDYFDGITVFEGVNCDGEVLSAEATADITAIEAVLRLAEKEENFDYDAFFRYYAKQYAYSSDYKWELHILGDDPHPLAYLRTNVVVQQFDEFYETYGVKEGDAMYLAPEDRILVW